MTGGWILSRQDDSILWSPEMYEIFGVEPESFTPSLDEIERRAHPDDVGRLRSFIGRLREGQGFASTYRMRRDDGAWRQLELRGWQELDLGGEVERVLGTVRDITESVATAAEHERVARQQFAGLRGAGDAICGMDANGAIRFHTPAFSALTHREGESLTGRRLHDLVHLDEDGTASHGAEECPFHDASQSGIQRTDPGFRRGDGTVIEVGYLQMFVDDPYTGSVISLCDVSDAQAAARLLDASHDEVQALSAERSELLRDLARAEERERLRIAADLHDDPIQALDAVRLRLEVALRGVAQDPVRELLDSVAREIGDAAERIRHLMFELMPPMDHRDLGAALERYCWLACEDSEIVYAVQAGPPELPEDTYVLAYRLVQEAVRNAVRHSQGSRVQIDFDTREGQLTVRVSDDGVGMLEPPRQSGTHAGMRFLLQRAAAGGGQVTFGVGLDGRGCTVELTLPIDQEVMS